MSPYWFQHAWHDPKANGGTVLWMCHVCRWSGMMPAEHKHVCKH